MSDEPKLTLKEAVEQMHVVLEMVDSDVWSNFNDGTEAGKRAEANFKVIKIQVLIFVKTLVGDNPIAMMAALFTALKELANTGNFVYNMTNEQRDKLKKEYGL